MAERSRAARHPEIVSTRRRWALPDTASYPDPTEMLDWVRFLQRYGRLPYPLEGIAQSSWTPPKPASLQRIEPAAVRQSVSGPTSTWPAPATPPVPSGRVIPEDLPGGPAYVSVRDPEAAPSARVAPPNARPAASPGMPLRAVEPTLRGRLGTPGLLHALLDWLTIQGGPVPPAPEAPRAFRERSAPSEWK